MPATSRTSGNSPSPGGWLAWGAVSLAHLQDYLAALEGRGLAARSRARKLSALRQFYRFLQREEKVKANPVELLDSPRLPQRLPNVLGEEEVAALLNGPDPATPLGQRNAALLEVLYATGLRVSELVGLTLKQLDLRRGVVRPLGKGSKERVVPMVAQATEKIELYLAQGRAQLLKGAPEPLSLRQWPGRQALPPGLLEDLEALRRQARGAGPEPPHPAPLHGHPSPVPGGQFAGDPTAAGPRRISPPPRSTPTWTRRA